MIYYQYEASVARTHKDLFQSCLMPKIGGAHCKKTIYRQGGEVEFVLDAQNALKWVTEFAKLLSKLLLPASINLEENYFTNNFLFSRTITTW